MQYRLWRTNLAQIGRLVPILSASVLTPIGYLLYTLAVRSTQGNPLSIEPFASQGMLVYLLVLSLTGAVIVLGWGWGLRFAPVVAISSLLLWPWAYVSVPIGSAAYASLPFVGLVLLTAVEGVFRYPEWVPSPATDVDDRYVLAVGLLHFVLGFGLQVYARRFFWMEYSPASALLMGGIYIISGLALFATGALSVQLWSRRRVVTPAIVTASWFAWGLYGTWTMRAHLPWGQFEGINWMGPTPYPDYLLKWPVLVMALLLSVGTEVIVLKVGHALSSDVKSRLT